METCEIAIFRLIVDTDTNGEVQLTINKKNKKNKEFVNIFTGSFKEGIKFFIREYFLLVNSDAGRLYPELVLPNENNGGCL